MPDILRATERLREAVVNFKLDPIYNDEVLTVLNALATAEATLAQLRLQAAIPHAAFDNPANMILPIRRILEGAPHA